MSFLMSTLRQTKQALRLPNLAVLDVSVRSHSTDEQPLSDRMKEFKRKLRETTPIEELGTQLPKHPNHEEEPLEAWPNGVNPHTGEIGGPKGPEPTRYGDWERKGRCVDF